MAGISLGYIALLALALAAVLAVALGSAWMLMRPRLSVRREIQPERVTVNELALGLVEVTNEATRPSPPLVAIDIVGDSSVEVAVPRTDPGGKRVSTYRLPTDRRAVVTVGPLVLTRTDPFGLVRFRQDHGGTRTLWVHPRRHVLLPLPASPARSFEGPTSETAPRGTITFHAIREYVLGDDLRHIHWRSTAHTGELMVREYIDTSLPDLTVVLDTRRDRHTDGSFEQAIEIAASLIVASADRLFPIRFMTTDGVVLDSGGGQHSTMTFLDRLAALSLENDGDFGLVDRILVGERRGYAVVTITGQADETDTRAMSLIRQRFGQAMVVAVRPEVGLVPALPGTTTVEAATSEGFAEIWNRGHFR